MDRAELQALQLAWSLGLGLGLGFLYDVYRVWFRRLKNDAGSRWLAAAGDIGWWLTALILAAAGLYRINGLELRLPILALAAAGVCVYMGFLSPVLFPLLWRLLGWLWRFLCWWGHCFGNALALLLAPLVFLVELGFILGRIIGRILKGLGRILARVGRVLLLPINRLVLSFKKHQKKVDFAVDFAEENDI